MKLLYQSEDLPRNDRSASFNGNNFKRDALNRIGVSQRKQFDVAQSTMHYNLKESWS